MMKKKLFIILLAGLLSANLAHAQTQALVVWLADGSTTDVELYTEPKVTFSADRMFIKSSVLDIEYKATDVVRFTYRGNGSGIDNLQAEADYTQADGRIVFHGISAEDKVAIYRTDGVRLPIRPDIQGTDAVLSLSSLPVGVYLFSVNGKTSKFVRK